LDKENRSLLSCLKQLCKLSNFILLLTAIAFSVFYNIYLLPILINSVTWYGKLFTVPLFNMKICCQSYFNALVLLIIFGAIFVYWEQQKNYWIRFGKSLKYFGPLTQHYFTVLLVCVVFSPLFKYSVLQKAVLFNGDWLALIFITAILSPIAGPKLSRKKKEGLLKIEEDTAPIHKADDDEIGMNGEIDKLKKYTEPTEHTSSRIIGLFGEWGSGKTSLLNLFTESVKKDDKYKTQTGIITINVHLYENTSELYINFFYALLKKLQEKVLLPRFDKYQIIKSFILPLFKGLNIDPILNKPMPETKISDYLETYSRWLIKMKLNIICLLDDCDRTTKPESVNDILKVLNLVKNDTYNIFLIVAIDPGQFARQYNKLQGCTNKEYDILQKYFGSNQIWLGTKNIMNKTDNPKLEEAVSENTKLIKGNRLLESMGMEDGENYIGFTRRWLGEEKNNNPRALVLFNEILYKNAQIASKRIRFRDIILFSIIEAFCKDLLFYIKNNYKILIPIIIPVENIEKSENITFYYKIILETHRNLMSVIENDFEKKIFLQLFRHWGFVEEYFGNKQVSIKDSMRSYYKNFNDDFITNTLSNPILLEAFLFPEKQSLFDDYTTFESHKADFLLLIEKSEDKENCLSEIEEFIISVSGKNSFYLFSIQSWMRKIMDTADNPKLKRNMFLYFVWSFGAQMNSSDFEQLLKDYINTDNTISSELLSLNNISAKVANIVFQQSSSGGTKDEICEKYLAWINKKIENTNSLFSSINDNEILRTLDIWGLAQRYLKSKRQLVGTEIDKYLISICEKDYSNYEKYLIHVLSFDTTNNLDDSIESKSFIPKEEFIKLTGQYLNNNKKGPILKTWKIEDLEQWYNKKMA